MLAQRRRGSRKSAILLANGPEIINVQKEEEFSTSRFLATGLNRRVFDLLAEKLAETVAASAVRRATAATVAAEPLRRLEIGSKADICLALSEVGLLDDLASLLCEGAQTLALTRAATATVNGDKPRLKRKLSV